MISESDWKENDISDRHRNATMLICQKKLGAGLYRKNCSNFEKYLSRLKNGADHDLAIDRIYSRRGFKLFGVTRLDVRNLSRHLN